MQASDAPRAGAPNRWPPGTPAAPDPPSRRRGSCCRRSFGHVVAGSTHREIGAQLYIAPKTVEHHVALIRAKLGAGSRAELLAMLREILADPA